MLHLCQLRHQLLLTQFHLNHTKRPVAVGVRLILALVMCFGLFSSTVVAQLSVTDVSPDAPYGDFSVAYNVDQTGRVYSVVLDPRDPSILYAASELAGVWKSRDGAKTWRQSGVGLRSGVSTSDLSLAVDSQNTQRLLYATQDDDGRPGNPYGGLWVSFDAAGDWQHVTLCGNGTDGITSVVFAAGHPFVTTSCGIWTTSSATLANGTWSTIPSPTAFSYKGAVLAAPLFGGQFLFACQGSRVFRSSDLGSTPGSWVAGPDLGGTCLRIAPAALTNEFKPSIVVAVHSTVKGPLNVSIINIDAQTRQDLGFFPYSGSGTPTVFAPHRASAPSSESRPGFAYDIYASDGYNFYVFDSQSSAWDPLEQAKTMGLHADTWGMAFPANYDPLGAKNCVGYAATDGGIFQHYPFFNNCTSSFRLSQGWSQAMSGLHALYSRTISGVSYTQGTTLYLPTGDNDVWVSTHVGSPPISWSYLGSSLGDAGHVFIDPKLPTNALATRNGIYNLFRSAVLLPTEPSIVVNLTPTLANPGAEPPGEGDLSQVLTLASEAAPIHGDYLAVKSVGYYGLFNQPCPAGSPPDLIVRNTQDSNGTNEANWVDLSPLDHFGPCQIAEIQTSGGHKETWVFVLTSDYDNAVYSGERKAGQIWRGVVDQGGTVRSWELTSKGLNRVGNFFVNPYDPFYLYATDLGDSDIKTSTNGGVTWQENTALTQIAKNGEFRIDCGYPDFKKPGRTAFFAGACSLADVKFNFLHPEIRVAALYPGGVAFSRDFGNHWIPLNVTRNEESADQELLELPISVYYDPYVRPGSSVSSVYVAFQGRSMIRVDGPFSTLMAAQAKVCVPCSRIQLQQGTTVNLVVNSLGARVPLRKGEDGLYYGTVVFDAASNKVLDYHYELGPLITETVSHSLSDSERATGVLMLSPPPAREVDPPIRNRGCAGTGVGCNDVIRPPKTPSSNSK